MHYKEEEIEMEANFENSTACPTRTKYTERDSRSAWNEDKCVVQKKDRLSFLNLYYVYNIEDVFQASLSFMEFFFKKLLTIEV